MPAAIAVASTVDAAYLPMAEVVASSIAASARSGRPVDYHIVYDGPDNWMTRRLERWRRGNVVVHLHRHSNRWRRYGKVGGLAPATLDRLSLPDTLGGLSRVIYLDADLIVQADLGPLFDTPLAGHPMAALRDRHVIEQTLRPGGGRGPAGMTMRQYLASVVGLHSDDEIRGYRQGGVLVMNLAALRAMDFSRRAEAVVAEKRTQLLYADQCVINIVLKDNMAELDPRWNALAFAVSPNSVADALPEFRDYAALQAADTRILHFAGNKPWVSLNLHGADRWWRQAWAAGLGPHFVLRHLKARSQRELATLGRKLGKLVKRTGLRGSA